MIVGVKHLVDRFDDATRQAMEGAAGLCLARSHYEIEVEHFLVKAFDVPDNDLDEILRHFEVDRSRLLRDLQNALEPLKTGNPRGPHFSPALLSMFHEAWSMASLVFDSSEIRTGHALLALLSEDKLRRISREMSKELGKIPADTLSAKFTEITSASREATRQSSKLNSTEKTIDSLSASKTPFLDQYTTDLTRAAQEHKIEPIIGRDAEIRQMIDVLMRRRQNNPILTGEAGVGKTAVVEGLAVKIAEGDVPDTLKAVRIHSLDLALLQAGAGVKGEFESRLKALVKEVNSSPTPVILFIDEAHTLIGAGGQAGQSDAANILKPALARGELRTIAATTWAEYKRYFERDAALTRRFQVVKIEEPSEALCESMLLGLLPSLEKHHQIRILDEAVTAAVRLSHRYMPGRQLPDKAVSVLDTACARVMLSQRTRPATMEVLTHRILSLESRKQILEREHSTGIDHMKEIALCKDEIHSLTSELATLEERHRQELALIGRIAAMHLSLEAPERSEKEAGSIGREDAILQLSDLREQLDRLQSRDPLAHFAVDAHVVAAVVAEWTGIPLGKMMDDEVLKLLRLESDLKKRVIGQDHALTAIAQRIWTSRANLDDPGKPVGVFMLAGPSGVGKTETALALADLLYGGEQNLITINMSEFQEPHSVSTLKGAPPGYVGYGEGGVLTEAVRRQPYSVVLLDEVEKAHPDVLELFFQVFDKGQIEDGEGRSIDFRNTLILLTTNAASETISRLTVDRNSLPVPENLAAAIRPELNRIFKPAFLGRTLIVPYYPVRDEVLKSIIRLKLGKVSGRLMQNHGVELVYEEDLVELICQRCVEVESGARNVDHLLSNTLLPEISRSLLAYMASNQPSYRVSVTISSEGSFAITWPDAEMVVKEGLNVE